MTARLLSFPTSQDRPAPDADPRATLLPVLAELHALLSIDPILGASPARVRFALSPAERARIAAAIDRADVAGRAAAAYALVTYDFPYALHQFLAGETHISEDRAKAIITCSAALQPQMFARAAEALGLAASPVPAFDAVALKAALFPHTQETATHLFRLSPAGA